MKAVVVSSPGPPSVLSIEEVPPPSPILPSDVLLQVTAAGVNRADIMQRQGLYPPPKGASTYLGLECSGTIEEVGSDVREWKKGDKVCALLAGGGYAEKVCVPSGQLLPVPRGLSLIEAASLPEAACTVWSTVFMGAQLKAGESFLVHGGSSGIGTFAIQLAKAFGARVFCTVGSVEKSERCLQLGADVAINYRTEDFVARVKEETGGAGVDVILDIVGGDYLSRNLKALREDGRLFVIGLQGGRFGEADLARMLTKRLSLLSAGLRGRPLEQKAEIVKAVRKYIWPKIEDGAIKPIVHSSFPLADARGAHELVESSVHIGKVLLVV